jgi:hypothetical protein
MIFQALCGIANLAYQNCFEFYMNFFTYPQRTAIIFFFRAGKPG